MKRILLIFGTRPEAIKMAPLVKSFQCHSATFDTRVCVTAQHRQMLDQVLDFFGINPAYDLNLMKNDQTLNSIWAAILVNLKPVLDEWQPEWVLVHGDTATSTAAALAAYFAGCKVGHVEAGLRTYDKRAPFPEEINRQLTSKLADLHFAPTQQASANLIREAINPAHVIVTGNTVIDALHQSREKVSAPDYTNPEVEHLKKLFDASRSNILVTGHRRENFGQGFINICHALKEIAAHPNTTVIYPVHLNPNVQKPVKEILEGTENVHLIPPLSYPSFVWAMEKAKIIITDSGGVQEEAPSLGKPVLVMRDTTERPEAVAAGTAILTGTNKEKIVAKTLELLDNPAYYASFGELENPYGDGKACQRILHALTSIQ
ncbi:MAG: UDP-N-acetylglucosamine 2-epimerase (non-hydrolyzing) [Prevotellaceae bacterium]|jgi:UDP-N-acetylglucosamine 2-epimerase (non-hydrolysing)|nr:UDP-N-acetylglucosamine 2-epimerase (non-hydrolyzing) [Prevotellaceae bacterium]